MIPHRRQLLALTALLPLLARAHGDHSAHAPSKRDAPPRSVKVSVGDAPLLDQDGRKVRLRTDVMAGRVVVIDFVYTTCTTICPIFTATMTSVHERLATHAGNERRDCQQQSRHRRLGHRTECHDDAVHAHRIAAEGEERIRQPYVQTIQQQTGLVVKDGAERAESVWYGSTSARSVSCEDRAFRNGPRQAR